MPDQPVDDETFSVILDNAEAHRVLGLFGAAIAAGAFPVTAEQRALLDARWALWLAHDLRVEQLTLRVDSVLRDLGIEACVLKGVALAHLHYDDPSHRVFGDVDILVDPQDFSVSATSISRALGAARVLPELQRGFDNRFGKEILLRLDQFEIDVHRMFVDGPFGLMVDPSDLVRGRRAFGVGGRELWAPSVSAMFLHACFAAALGDWPPRLIPRRDLAQIVLRPRDEASALDVCDALSLARRWKSEAVVATAVRTAWDVLGIDVSHPIEAWASSYEISRGDRMLLRSYRGVGRGYSSQLASLWVLPGIRPRLAYALAVAVPSREYLAVRGLRRRDLASRLVKSLRPER